MHKAGVRPATLLLLAIAALPGCSGLSSPRPAGPAATLLAGEDLSREERCELAFASLRSASATPAERSRAGTRLRDLSCGGEKAAP